MKIYFVLTAIAHSIFSAAIAFADSPSCTHIFSAKTNQTVQSQHPAVAEHFAWFLENTEKAFSPGWYLSTVAVSPREIRGANAVYPGRCETNIHNLLHAIRGRNVDISKMKVLFLSPKEWGSFAPSGARSAKIWTYHVVLVSEGRVYDFDMADWREFPQVNEYFPKMFGGIEPHVRLDRRRDPSLAEGGMNNLMVTQYNALTYYIEFFQKGAEELSKLAEVRNTPLTEFLNQNVLRRISTKIETRLGHATEGSPGRFENIRVAWHVNSSGRVVKTFVPNAIDRLEEYGPNVNDPSSVNKIRQEVIQIINSEHFSPSPSNQVLVFQKSWRIWVPN